MSENRKRLCWCQKERLLLFCPEVLNSGERRLWCLPKRSVTRERRVSWCQCFRSYQMDFSAFCCKKKKPTISPQKKNNDLHSGKLWWSKFSFHELFKLWSEFLKPTRALRFWKSIDFYNFEFFSPAELWETVISDHVLLFLDSLSAERLQFGEALNNQTNKTARFHKVHEGFGRAVWFPLWCSCWKSQLSFPFAGSVEGFPKRDLSS